jgi:hypothetical protein
MRKLMFETQCSRCDRKEMQEPSQEELQEELAAGDKAPGLEDALSFYASLGSTEVKFKDLCTPCRRTITAVLEQVGKRIDGVSPDRKQVEKKAFAKKPQEAKGKTAAPSHGAPSDPNHAPPAQPAKAVASGLRP